MNKISKNVGARIKEFRLVNGMSRNQLGKLIGVTGQQLQKYEKGQNRISLDMLFVIATALNMDFLEFCKDINNPIKPTTPKGRLLIELSREFIRMTDVKQQVSLVAMARTLS